MSSTAAGFRGRGPIRLPPISGTMPTFVGLCSSGLAPILREDGLRLGGRCQWALDAALQAVEWPCQPLRFDSVVLRTALGSCSRLL